MASIRWEIVETLQHVHGWSDRRLAQELHLSASHVCDVKRGRRKPTIEFIDRLAEVFHLNYDRLIVHPSIKLESPIDGRIGITHQENGAKVRGLCRDPNHWEDLNGKAQGRREREAAKLIPVGTRKRMYPRRQW